MILPEGWSTRPLSEVVELQRGHDLPADERRPGGVPIIGSFGITGFHDSTRYQGPGVAIGRSGASIGKATFVAGRFWPLNTCLFAKDFRDNDPRWVYRLLDWTDFTAFNSGSAQPSLNRNFIASITVPVPPVATQRAIAEVLGALDDKIAANCQSLRSAEALSQAHYTHACAHHMKDAPLSRLARFVNGRAYTKDASGTGRVVIRIAELNSGIGNSTVRNDIAVPDDNTARPGDLLFAWSGSLTVARWYRAEAIVNQHIFKVIPNDGVPIWLVNEALRWKLKEFKAIAAYRATTMGHIQRKHLDAPVPIPASGVMSELDGLMASLWDLSLSLEMENETLATTRDELLPLLMSGKVRVKDAEKAIEGVV